MALSTLILLGLFVVVSVVALILDYRLKYVSKDGRTKVHVMTRRWWVWVAALVLLITSATNAVRDHRSAKAQQNFEAGISDVKDTQAALLRKVDRLSIASTNPGADPQLRAQLVDAKRELQIIDTKIVDLEAWKADRDMRSMSASLKAQRAKEIEEERVRVTAKPYWDNSRPIYQFTIQRLEEILGDLARQKGQTKWTSYGGIPLEPTSGELGELGIGTNKNWHLKILTDLAPALRIRSENGLVFYLASNPQIVVVSLRDESKSLFHEEGVPTKFRETVEPAIRDFVLELSERDKAGQK